jgi:hypothetical protein
MVKRLWLALQALTQFLPQKKIKFLSWLNPSKEKNPEQDLKLLN